MTEMIERVAKAISGAPFPSKRSKDKARAAIEAMREPTEAMHAVLFRANVSLTDTGAVWGLLIDAAIAEEEAK